ncbi:MAG: hypothetical protein HY725_20810 [Candidatus Rokubacteria bacterium]|nr:hypothetical protein [Candidatus Rokubacteria bacterium]
MRYGVVVGIIGIAVCGGTMSAAGDGLYELVVRTSDSLLRGTVDLEEKVTVSVKGDRMRQEMRGTRVVVTRRGKRYQKPGHHVTLDQLDRGRRYELDLDAGTYGEESFADLRRRHEEEIAAAEKTLGLKPGDAPPSVAVSVERPGERHQVHGRECERVILKAAREVVVVATRGSEPAGQTPSRFSMVFDLCVAHDAGLLGEVRSVEDRVADLAGMRGDLLERQLRIFGARRDSFAVFELLQHLLEREQQSLGGVPIRWERLFVGPRRDQPQVTLFRHRGEVTRIEGRTLDPGQFELPAGLKLEQPKLAR